MYLLKSKENNEKRESRDLQNKSRKFVERQIRSASVDSSGLKGDDLLSSSLEKYDVDELPDGSVISPQKIISSPEDRETSVRSAEYIGSFSVCGVDQQSRTEYVRGQLSSLLDGRSKEVLLVISISGIKVCSKNGQSVYMAHAVKRISYATCDLQNCQFAIIAREPKGSASTQHCHAFRTSTPQQAEELNTLVGDMFKMTYAAERQKNSPTFNDMIEEQVAKQRAKFEEVHGMQQDDLQKRLSQISQSGVSQVQFERDMQMLSIQQDEERRREKVGQNKVWAKHAAGKAKHRSPIAEQSQNNLSRQSAANSTQFNSNNNHKMAPQTIASNSRPSASTHVPVVIPAIHSLRNSDLFHNSSNDMENIKGSPVMAMKQTIDEQFEGSGLGIKVEDYTYPVSHWRPPQSNANNVPNREISSIMSSRPLPDTPSHHSNGVRNKDKSKFKTRRPKSLDSQDTSENLQQFGRSNTRDKERLKNRDIGRVRPNSRDIQRPNSQIIEQPNSQGQGQNGWDLQRPHSRDKERPNMQNIPRANSQDSPQGNETSYRYNVLEKRNSPENHEPPHNNHDTPTFPDNMREHIYDHGEIYNNHDNPEDAYRFNTQPSSDAWQRRYQNSSPGNESQDQACAPPTPTRYDSLKRLEAEGLIDCNTLQQAAWYQAGIPREIALEVLSTEDIGAFIVRESSTHPNCFALSVKVPKYDNPHGINHYLIQRTPKGVRLKGLDKEWPSLTSLVIHLTVMAEILPCTLKLARNARNPAFRDYEGEGGADAENDGDEDYQRLTDFSSMMKDMK
ncbi:unnamed protein product [Owenia fusiformis]|uniref:SH2 domain-containing protein n=1 Tax=Owenia fusiformis TaxID=6347 RepID=A0A8S4N3F9_OWEFU|nr:unnamed protein product [Owenia fusiformis]